MHDGNWGKGIDRRSGRWVSLTIMLIAFWGGIVRLGATVNRRPRQGRRNAAPGLLVGPRAPSPAPETLPIAERRRRPAGIRREHARTVPQPCSRQGLRWTHHPGVPRGSSDH